MGFLVVFREDIVIVRIVYFRMVIGFDVWVVFNSVKFSMVRYW